MRLFCAPALALLLASGAPVLAHDGRTDFPAAPVPQRLMHGAIQESDVTLLFDYLRDAIRAAAEGRDPPAPPRELEKRAEELGTELKTRGTLAALLLLSTVEKQVSALIREAVPPPRPKALPPTVPYTAVSDRR